MSEYSTKAPGVYVKEVETGQRPIQAVGTNTAGFIGVAPWKTQFVGQARHIFNWGRFKDYYFLPPFTTEEEIAQEKKAEQAVAKKNQEIENLKAKLTSETLEAATKDQQITTLNDQLKQKQTDEPEAAGKAQSIIDLLKQMQSSEQEAAKNMQAITDLLVQQQPADKDAAQKAQAITGQLAKLQIADPEAAQKTKLIDELTQQQTDHPEAAQTVLAIASLQIQLQNVTKEAEQKQQQVSILQEQLRQATLENKRLADAELERKKQAAAAPKTQEDVDLQKYPDYPWTNLAHAVYGFFLNGGSDCYVVNLGEGDGAVSMEDGLKELEKIDEIAILAAPGYTDEDTYEKIKGQCERLKDRVGILDCPNEITPDIIEKLGTDPEGPQSGWRRPVSQDGYITLYAPWLKVANPNSKTNKATRTVTVPPSGHIAGIWARSDTNRGAHKAPANEAVSGALDLEYQFLQAEQAMLNGHGVNCIRYFSGAGNLVWGARTLATDSLWRYLNIRRLFNQIEESIAEGTRWIVFEPNDRPLWQAIKRDVTAFLMPFWRRGALMGKTPEEAFFVKCDEENNPLDQRKNGEVHIDIGLAPVYPAEFVVFQISQYEAESEVKVSGA